MRTLSYRLVKEMFQFHLKATTIFARNSSSLLNVIKTRLEPITPRNHVVFALSLNANAEAVETVPKLWESSIGCLTAPWPLLPDHVACSILQVPYGMGRPFVSRIPGRPPVQVGRYHAMHQNSTLDEYDLSAASYNRAMKQTGGALRAEEHAIPDGLNPIVYAPNYLLVSLPLTQAQLSERICNLLYTSRTLRLKDYKHRWTIIIPILPRYFQYSSALARHFLKYYHSPASLLHRLRLLQDIQSPSS